MKRRSIWTAHIKISLWTIPIRVYTALNEADRITFNQLHKDFHQRLKQLLVARAMRRNGICTSPTSGRTGAHSIRNKGVARCWHRLERLEGILLCVSITFQQG